MLGVLTHKQLSPPSPAFTHHHIQVSVKGKFENAASRKAKCTAPDRCLTNSPFAVHVLCVVFLDFFPLCASRDFSTSVFNRGTMNMGVSKGHKGENPSSWEHKSSCFPAPSKHTLMLAAPPCPARDQRTTLPDAVQTHFPYISYEWRSPV